ncbi:probable dolichyl pyrophosphate Man9GlcNAc2 alpha-1,3-glucosyltransferase isoform X1 [Rhododendron vialii]|uniref:probable dolichyl pyrophosphate Man9GlcNAc2 alpha-1,3-glucosyltransferase isoform X1 n=1 Tax=Rhododendron vialii TaxID=182163 RepID=UPI00266040B6|nr:probable dolichyl pyrophosphate Man9GlcNAc2 alpha-1,3-glucosyltransferase isoform X1 [Rhododendron vialii]XP_058180508.1 probable dolichyl pyrophosphate Man9GlcNAc2 alpha-1,3-glucosyltransferase isoform X1 [Rhododendron vialii]
MEKRKRTNALKDDENEDNIWWLVVQRGLAPSFISLSLFALLVRVAVSLHPYSGAGKPPKYGDFEAQRHWMEITLNLPASEWYRNSTANDLSYWGLDYPPLTAYQSYIHGLILRNFLPDSVSLQTSHGHESYLGKLLMRWTVLSSDVLMFFPAVFYFIVVYYSGSRTGCKNDWAWHVAMILLNPCLILIDHGHFQYNCISLGLTIGAVAAILSDKDLLACFLFSLALNHKQMSAYFAPAFFSYLLGKCLRRQNPLLEVLKLGFVVIGTFSIVWWPYLQSVEAFLQVLSRLAPFERGIYEDYVANFWCTSSLLIKWKRLFTIPSLKLLSLGATVSASLPSMVPQIWAPSKQGFLYGLLNSSLSFYLFSYQVHEKSILLPLLPASFLAIDEPFLFKWMMHYALLSMFPLMCRDELILPYISLSALFILLYHAPGGRKEKRDALSPSNLKSFVVVFLVLCSLVLHVVYFAVSPPEKYPFLFEAMIMLLCFSQFLFITGYTNIKQWMTLKDSALENKEKKHL